MANIAFFIGALVPTILVSQIFLFVTRSWKEGGNIRIVVCHTLSLLLIAVIAGMGMADGGAFAGAKAFLAYAPAQAVWLVINLVYARGRRLNEKEAD